MESSGNFEEQSEPAPRTTGLPGFGLIRQPRIEFCTDVPAPDGSYRSVSYTYFRIPYLRMHPDNQVRLTAAQADAIDRIHRFAALQSIAKKVETLRYPVLWDAVRTWAPPLHDPEQLLRHRLYRHLQDARHASRLNALPTVPTATGSTERPTPHGTLALIDRIPHPAITLSDTDFTAIGTNTSGHIITAVIESHTASQLRLHFTQAIHR